MISKTFIYLFIFCLSYLIIKYLFGKNKEGLDNKCKKKACKTVAVHKNKLASQDTKQKISDVKKEIETMIENASKIVEKNGNQIKENTKNIQKNKDNEKKMKEVLK